MMKRALISVSDKTNLISFAKGLEKNGYEIISTGGTEKVLKEAGLKTMNISDITSFPEIMDGRVKTLHPNVHGGLLCVRDNPEHIDALVKNNIELIDLVVVNLYPFKETLKSQASHEELIENIDIGGPSMLRSAAKNHKFVTVCVDPKDYDMVLNEIEASGDTVLETKKYLAAKVFRHTAAYDTLIGNYLTEMSGEKFPESYTVTFEKVQDLRYGENPHQEAAFYKTPFTGLSLANAKQLNGKELSYNNIQDTNAALEILKEFIAPTVVAVKHMNPCGVGSGTNLDLAWKRAYEADPVSIFGGIIATNEIIDKKNAELMAELFLEVIVAPSFTKEALEVLTKKKNLRLLILDTTLNVLNTKKIVTVNDGILVQDMDLKPLDSNSLKCVTDRQPTEQEMIDLLFTWKVVKHVKSNAIVIGKNNQTVGVGAGQMNRVGSAKIAFEYGKSNTAGCVLASDAFFPMADTVELAANHGITAIIQPGGSIKDQLSIDACNKHGIAMIFTDIRHFKH
ncbi:MAG: bifunctional phosphoribosylaminoimidazolecarboxamide formyltransferase/IMP cyclohydrolase [Fusobacteriaceae bacterium]